MSLPSSSPAAFSEVRLMEDIATRCTPHIPAGQESWATKLQQWHVQSTVPLWGKRTRDLAQQRHLLIIVVSGQEVLHQEPSHSSYPGLLSPRKILLTRCFGTAQIHLKCGKDLNNIVINVCTGTWGPKRWRDLPRHSQEEKGRAETHTQVVALGPVSPLLILLSLSQWI